MPLPQRKTLPHEIPAWVRVEDAIYFLTICCDPRGKNQLANTHIAAALLETVAYRNAQQVWHAHVFLLMPDHAHALVSFPPGSKPMDAIVAQWKEWTAKRKGITWQRGFFEHRLRGEETLRNKTEYILQNPVRAGLVSQAEDWPFVWVPR